MTSAGEGSPSAEQLEAMLEVQPVTMAESPRAALDALAESARRERLEHEAFFTRLAESGALGDLNRWLAEPEGRDDPGLEE